MADSLQSLITRDHERSRVPRPWRSEAGAWLFNLGLIAFLAALVFAAGLFFYRNSLEKSRTTWADQVKTQEDDLRPDLLQQLVDLAHQLSSTSSLLSNHTFASNVFAFLEASTLPRVQFTSFGLVGAKVDLAAVADSFQTVADQVGILETNPQVVKVDFGGLSRLDAGRVNFRITILLKPGLLKLVPGAGQVPPAPGG